MNLSIQEGNLLRKGSHGQHQNKPHSWLNLTLKYVQTTNLQRDEKTHQHEENLIQNLYRNIADLKRKIKLFKMIIGNLEGRYDLSASVFLTSCCASFLVSSEPDGNDRKKR